MTVNPRQIKIWDLSTASENPLSWLESPEDRATLHKLSTFWVDDRNKTGRASSTTEQPGQPARLCGVWIDFPRLLSLLFLIAIVLRASGFDPSIPLLSFILSRPRYHLRTGIAIRVLEAYRRRRWAISCASRFVASHLFMNRGTHSCRLSRQEWVHPYALPSLTAGRSVHCRSPIL